ncbi:hypothetical protein CC86DRAFT_413239 [Ophiobolus disseminans]|uniref:Uncharacterized protein n=1 Tax=Ophiobolus disseminans TaxID=1469910 RepID=A0A6A6ZFW2_9PLEO|nr:hypothetical protein CC86DRAFT_413239 [Ophiobolus disseminans]
MSINSWQTKLGQALHHNHTFLNSSNAASHWEAMSKIEAKLRVPKPDKDEEYSLRITRLEIIHLLQRVLAQTQQRGAAPRKCDVKIVMSFLDMYLRFDKKRHWLSDAQYQEFEPGEFRRVDVDSRSKTDEQMFLWLVMLVKVATFWGIGVVEIQKNASKCMMRFVDEAYGFVAFMRYRKVGDGWMSREG